jgi:murein DD-endopeptidase MepM/ murein hydrolase activator NlpD
VSGFSVIGTPYKGTHTLGNWQSDNAYDIGEPVGTPVPAVISGKITRVGSLGAAPGSRFACQRVQIDGDDGQAVWYGHLSQTTVKLGQRVNAGDEIGLSGSANGVAHLHFAALKSPSQFLPALHAGPGAQAGSIVTKVAGAVGDAVAGEANKAAAATAKAAVSALWGAVGQDGTRALLYALLVLGGVALAVVGVARATGIGQKITAAATTAGKAALV